MSTTESCRNSDVTDPAQLNRDLCHTFDQYLESIEKKFTDEEDISRTELAKTLYVARVLSRFADEVLNKLGLDPINGRPTIFVDGEEEAFISLKSVREEFMMEEGQEVDLYLGFYSKDLRYKVVKEEGEEGPGRLKRVTP